MYALDLLLFVVASAAQFWVQGVWTLFALRLVLGVAIGADYPIVSALMAEFAPKRQRGMLLAGLIGAWWLGYTVSFVRVDTLSRPIRAPPGDGCLPQARRPLPWSPFCGGESPSLRCG